MPRNILPESQIHPAVRDKIANWKTDIVKEVQAAVAANDIVGGHAAESGPKRARKALAPPVSVQVSRVRELSLRIPPPSPSSSGPAGRLFPWCSSRACSSAAHDLVRLIEKGSWG
jgi:hypothetical protein